MPRYALLILLLPLCGMILPCGKTFAQQEDEGLLYFPPELTAMVTQSHRWRYDRDSDKAPNDGKQDPIVLNRTIDSHTSPLLPILFFEAGESNPPDRYYIFSTSMETDDYTDTTGTNAWGEINLYRDALNIIGYRMGRLPAETISLEGGYSTEPGESPEVAAARAEYIRDYLVNIWKIEPERIALLPPRRMCDSAANIFRQEEAQCVLIHPGTFDLVKPVCYRSTSYVISYLDLTMMLQPHTETPEDVAAMEIVLRAGDEIISRTEVPGNLDSVLYRWEGSWVTYAAFFEEAGGLEISAIVYQTDGTTRTSNTVYIPVTINTDSTADDIDSLSIILPFFFAGQTEISPLQKHVLDHALGNILTEGADQGGAYSVSIEAVGEAGEDPAADKTTLLSRRIEYRNRESQIDAIYQNSTWEVPITLHTPESDKRYDFDASFYGDQKPLLNEARNAQEELSSLLLPANGEIRMESMLGHREESIRQYLATRYGGMGNLDTTQISLEHVLYISMPKEVGRPREAVCLCYYTPEERFYKRKVILSIQPPYNEYDYESEYNEGEYNEEGYEEYGGERDPNEVYPEEEYQENEETP